MLDKTLVALEDRLDNGDQVMTAMGLQNVPLSAKDLIRLADVVFDKRQLVRNLPTQIDGDSSKLASLAEKLSQLGQARREGVVYGQAELMPSEAGSEATKAVPAKEEALNG